ncbi:MAG: hypothetical protein HC842_07610, partial [Cytophagales bacterium]|nr:hypothetical protein [Cytophagales bacterium]
MNPIQPHDHGPIYAETTAEHLQHFIVEPWNAISSLAIVAPGLYWLWTLRGRYRQHRFLLYCCVLLVLGGLGSTFFHAFRAARWVIVLDFLPTTIMSMSIAYFYWEKLLGRWYRTLGVMVPFIGIRFVLYGQVPPHTLINLGYLSAGIMFGLPLIFYSARLGWRGIAWVALGLALLILSLIFREVDPRGLVSWPQGTHFLWHIFSGLGAYFLSLFVKMTE